MAVEYLIVIKTRAGSPQYKQTGDGAGFGDDFMDAISTE
jgi:hypothetical protein